MKKFFLILIFLFSINQSFASNKEKIIQNLSEIENLSFNFEQNINGKIEKGYCVLKYPKKIFCKYNSQYKKILVSDGKYLVIKTTEGRYVYPIDKTPLNLILNKTFLIDKIKILKSRIIDDKFINYKFLENDNEINLFFNKKSFNLIGWQTLDIYQNLNITYLSSIKKNIELDNKLFALPQ